MGTDLQQSYIMYLRPKTKMPVLYILHLEFFLLYMDKTAEIILLMGTIDDKYQERVFKKSSKPAPE